MPDPKECLNCQHEPGNPRKEPVKFCMGGPHDLGTAIRRLRGARPQWKLAEDAGIKPSTWSEYERGRRIPRGKNMARIAEALGVDSRVLEREVLNVSRERLSLEEIGAVSAADSSDSQIKAIDRIVRAMDHKLDELLEAKKLLLMLRQLLNSRETGARV
jgi:transcriptional regulator with XRE-family HTH domain